MYLHREEHTISRMARVLEVSESGYYKWLKNRNMTTFRELENMEFLEEIKRIHKESKYSFGILKITAAINENREKSERINHKRVERLMKENNIYSKVKKKYVVTTDSSNSSNIAENLLKIDFTASKPGVKLVSDTTYIPTKEGTVYAAVIIDLYGRMPVGLAMSTKNDTELVVECFYDMKTMYKPKKGCIIHSDRGSTYASNKYKEVLEDNDMVPSMSKKGDCWDNAVNESFFGKLKSEWLDDNIDTISEAKALVYEYVWDFYPKKRPHQSIDYLTPYKYYNMGKNKEISNISEEPEEKSPEGLALDFFSLKNDIIGISK